MTLAERLATAGFPPAVSNGVRMAFTPGRGRTAVPVRAALVGVVVGTVGLGECALVFAGALDHLTASPAGTAHPGTSRRATSRSNNPCGSGAYGVGATPGIAALDEVCAQSVEMDGHSVDAIAVLRRVRGSGIRVHRRGWSWAAGADEVVLGAKTMQRLGKGIGDGVVVTRRSTRRRFRVWSGAKCSHGWRRARRSPTAPD